MEDLREVMVKKIPERKCAGCAQRFPKRELIRVVRTPEGNVELDSVGKKNGRGVYLCRCPECFKKVRKGDRLSRSLETKVSDEIYDSIESIIKEGVADAESDGGSV